MHTLAGMLSDFSKTECTPKSTWNNEGIQIYYRFSVEEDETFNHLPSNCSVLCNTGLVLQNALAPRSI